MLRAFLQGSFLIAAVTALLSLGACSSVNTSSSSVSAVQMAAENYAVKQTATTATLTVFRSGSGTNAISVSYQTADGTAVAGTDYTATSGTLQWAEGDTTPQIITVPMKASTFTGSKSFSLNLVDPSASTTIGSPGSSSVAIEGENSSAETVQLGAANYAVTQQSGSLSVSVTRAGGAVGAISVAYSTADGTAVAGTDYTAASGTLSWADGDASSQTFSIPISTATAFSGSKTFTIALSSAGSATLGAPSIATASISGSDSAPVGTLQLAASNYDVAQNAGTVTVTVDRVDGSSGAVTVSYGTTDGTAVAGADYTAATGTLSWADGDATAKTFTVAISNASSFTGDKSFTVAITNPSAGAAISNPGSATVVIAGEGSAAVGSVELSASSDNVAQGAGTVTLTANRSGGSSGAISVAYATKNGSAIAGTDYTSATGTLSWADGDATAKTFSVAISNATPFSGTKSFSTTLSTPTGGAAIGSPSTATVSISGDAVAAVGSLQLSSSTDSVAQSGGSVTVTVNRTGGSSGAVSVAYATSNGTAISGSDYTAESGTLSWASGDATSKSFTVPVSNAIPFTGSKSFTVTIASPSGGATLGSPTSATVTISGSAASSTTGTFWVYYNGVFNWAGDWSFEATPNYKDTAGVPIEGPYDIAVTGQSNGGWQPYVSGSCQTNIADCFVTTPYKYLVMSLKPTVSGQGWDVMFHSAGDTDDGATLSILPYGPTPVVGQWGTYKIPLSAFALTDTTVLKFFIQGSNNGSGSWYADNVGFSVD